METLTDQNWLLSVGTFLPLVGVLVMMFIPRSEEDTHKLIGIVTAGATLAIGIVTLFAFDYGQSEKLQFFVDAEWIPVINSNYTIGLDGISLPLYILSMAVTFLVMVYTWNNMPDAGNPKAFYMLMLVLQTGMAGTFIAQDLILFFVFFEVVLLPMYFMIGVWGGEQRKYASLKFFLYTMFGSAFMLVAFLALFFQTGGDSFGFAHLVEMGSSIDRDVQVWIFAGMFLGFAVKVPMFPFHTWLPDAHTQAPTQGSVILAAILLKLGTYGFVRFSLPILPDATRAFVPMMVGLSIIGIVYGALCALAQHDWKRLVAYSSVSHLGMAMLGMFALTPVGITGSILQQINHGISTGALFLIVGIVYERRHTREISEYGGLSKPMPVYAAVFMIMTMSSIGLPALNGFIGEVLILQGVFVVSKVWAAFAATGIVLGAGYMLWLYQRTMFGKVENPKNEHLADLNLREFATFAPLIVLAVWIGLYPSPFLQRLEHPVRAVMARVNTAYPATALNAADCDSDEAKAAARAAGTPSFIEPPCTDGSAATPPAKPDGGH
jgi:NADH-quinone oxidoreductase subunit M